MSLVAEVVSTLDGFCHSVTPTTLGGGVVGDPLVPPDPFSP